MTLFTLPEDKLVLSFFFFFFSVNFDNVTVVTFSIFIKLKSLSKTQLGVVQCEMENSDQNISDKLDSQGIAIKLWFNILNPLIEIHLRCQEVELKVSLVKSEKGSLGFTLTKGNDHGCYIHDIVQDPAKGDGRLRPGDRMIMVRFIHNPLFWSELTACFSLCWCIVHLAVIVSNLVS